MLERVGDVDLRLASAESLRTHEDMLRWITRQRGRQGAVLAVNAPMIVENTGGSRPCDRLLQEHFQRFRVDEYTNNIVSSSHPRTIGKGLVRMGFDLDPTAESDCLVETHTQAAQVMLFGVDRPVRLKAGPIGARKEAVARLRDLIGSALMNAEPRLLAGPELERLMTAHLPDLNGTRLGEVEERLEALLCAYVAAWLGIHGLEASAVLGDMNTGYILLPNPQRG